MLALVSYVIVAVNERLHPDAPKGKHAAKASDNHGPRNRKKYKGRRRVAR